jgi:hypothetical protein
MVVLAPCTIGGHDDSVTPGSFGGSGTRGRFDSLVCWRIRTTCEVHPSACSVGGLQAVRRCSEAPVSLIQPPFRRYGLSIGLSSSGADCARGAPARCCARKSHGWRRDQPFAISAVSASRSPRPLVASETSPRSRHVETSILSFIQPFPVPFASTRKNSAPTMEPLSRRATKAFHPPCCVLGMGLPHQGASRI